MTHLSKADWDRCREPEVMFRQFADRHSPQLSLFACECCHRIWNLITDSRLRGAVELRELIDRGEASESHMDDIAKAARKARWEIRMALPPGVDEFAPLAAGAWAAGAASNAAYGNYHAVSRFSAYAAACISGIDWQTAFDAERAVQCDLLREMCDYPHAECRDL